MTAEPYDIAELFQGSDRLWYWRLKADNHEIIAQSEGYTSKQAARETLATHFPNAVVLEEES